MPSVFPGISRSNIWANEEEKMGCATVNEIDWNETKREKSVHDERIIMAIVIIIIIISPSLHP